MGGVGASRSDCAAALPAQASSADRRQAAAGVARRSDPAARIGMVRVSLVADGGGVADETVRPLDEVLHVGRVRVPTVVLAPGELPVQQARQYGRHLRRMIV